MNIKKIIREEMGVSGGILVEDHDINWMEDIKPTFKNIDFKFNGKEYWLDLSTLNPNERREISLYLKKYTNLLTFNYDIDNILNLTFNGMVIHCGGEDDDYVPVEGHLCFMRETFSDDEYNHNSEYVDGREVLSYARLLEKNGGGGYQ